MDRYVYDDVKELAEELVFCDDGSYLMVAACCGYDIAKDLTKCLIEKFGCEIEDIELNSVSLNGYDKEYYVFCDDGKISVEPAYVEGNYVSVGDDSICFIHEDCSSKIINVNDECELVEFAIGEYDDDCDGECNNCEYNVSDSKKYLDTTSGSSYKINGKEVTKSEFDDKYKEISCKMKEFDDEFNDIMRGYFYNHSRMLDMYNNIYDMLF